MNNQNESPFGNPRFIFAIVLVFFALWGWQYYVNKKYPPVTPVAKVNSQVVENNKTDANTEVSTSKNVKTDTKLIKPNIEKIISYEDDEIKWTISSHGMGINQIVLKKYFDKTQKQIVFENTSGHFAVLANEQPVDFSIEQISETEFLGSAQIGNEKLTRRLKFNKESKSFDSEISFNSGFNSISLNTSERQHESSGGSFLMPSFDFQNFLYKDKEKVKTEDILHRTPDEIFSFSAPTTGMVAISSQYFTQSYIDRSEILPKAEMSVKNKTADLKVVYDLKETKVKNVLGKIYIGPKLGEALAKVDPVLPEVMDYGVFGFISKPLLVLMKFMFGIFGNWGVAIIALTIVMRLIMLPFNIVSFKSARAMQRIQPQLQAVREKYKNDPMAVNRETMALMKEHNANPLSSCLPMLIQIPVFFALWRTIGSSIEIYQQPFFGWITDLSSHDKFFVLPVLMGVTMYFQQKLTPTTVDPMQAKILNFMPILFSVFMLSLPSGLTLYNFISSLFGVIQQYFLLRDKTKA